MQNKIPEYRELSTEELEALHSINEMGSELFELIEKLKKIDSVDKRWLNIATVDLQKGCMSARRSITKPNTF